MKKALLFSVVLLFVGTSAHPQAALGTHVFDGSVELISYAFATLKSVNGEVYLTQGAHDSSRFDLLNLNNGCTTRLCIIYGDRFGNNWDIFHIDGGVVSRTRMVPIGKYKWTDSFTVPYVEPWSALAPGESRNITVNTSGGDGVDGRDGVAGSSGGVAQMSGGTLSVSKSVKKPDYANASLGRQVSSTVTTADGKTRNDPYSPVVEAQLGYMYVVRVMDDHRDYYVLLRVDELKRGERAVLSYKRFELP